MPQHDLVVIGAGPGGYVAAIRAAQLGLNVGCIDKNAALGGTCLRVGCIPSKALLESSERFYEARETFSQHGIRLGKVDLDLPVMLKRKEQIVETLTRGVDALFKKNKITRYHGHGKLAGQGRVAAESNNGTVELEAQHILIATGSEPGKLKGVELVDDRIGTSTEALSYQQVPEHLVVIGAGYIGVELGSVWRRLGAKVTILEYLDRILSGMDTEIAGEAKKLFEKQGIEFQLGARVTAARVERRRCVVECEGHKPIACDRVLLAAGRVPYTEGLGLETAGVELDAKGRIKVDEHFATTAKGVYAIGDVIGGAMLAHKAEDEGIACVERLVTGYGHVNYDAIPAVVYTHPEIGTVGKTEDELKAGGVNYRKGSFPLKANGRAMTLGATEGRVKILADAATDRILGVHILAARAGDLIAEAAAAMEFVASSEDLARTSHAHPTLAEAIREAAFDVDKRTINY
jgi:dihydrolipoamide dehydrogenase